MYWYCTLWKCLGLLVEELHCFNKGLWQNFTGFFSSCMEGLSGKDHIESSLGAGTVFSFLFVQGLAYAGAPRCYDHTNN